MAIWGIDFERFVSLEIFFGTWKGIISLMFLLGAIGAVANHRYVLAGFSFAIFIGLILSTWWAI